jgi:hypothetical protein
MAPVLQGMAGLDRHHLDILVAQVVENQGVVVENLAEVHTLLEGNQAVQGNPTEMDNLVELDNQPVDSQAVMDNRTVLDNLAEDNLAEDNLDILVQEVHPDNLVPRHDWVVEQLLPSDNHLDSLQLSIVTAILTYTDRRMILFSKGFVVLSIKPTILHILGYF